MNNSVQNSDFDTSGSHLSVDEVIDPAIQPPHVNQRLPWELHAQIIQHLTDLADLYHLRAVNKFYEQQCMEQIYERYLKGSIIDFWQHDTLATPIGGSDSPLPCRQRSN